jgi:glyoxylase-like metal-dependent hydrolase (beta-lactamase superfamily II)
VRVGGVDVTPIVDAVGVLGPYAELYPDVPVEAWAPYRERYPDLFAGDDWRIPCTSYLLRSAGQRVLVDTGVGPAGLWDWPAEWEGRLPDELDPAEVDLVFLTHLHIDHVGWNADAEGRPLFHRYVVHEEGLAFARTQSERPHIRRAILPVDFEKVSGETELAPGVVAFETPGHYPGHMSVRLGDEGIVLGDAAVHPALLDHPEWRYVSDIDFERSAHTRRELLPELEGKVVLCGHFPNGGEWRPVTPEHRGSDPLEAT